MDLGGRPRAVARPFALPAHVQGKRKRAGACGLRGGNGSREGFEDSYHRLGHQLVPPEMGQWDLTPSVARTKREFRIKVRILTPHDKQVNRASTERVARAQKAASSFPLQAILCYATFLRHVVSQRSFRTTNRGIDTDSPREGRTAPGKGCYSQVTQTEVGVYIDVSSRQAHS